MWRLVPARSAGGGVLGPGLEGFGLTAHDSYNKRACPSSKSPTPPQKCILTLSRWFKGSTDVRPPRHTFEDVLHRIAQVTP